MLGLAASHLTLYGCNYSSHAILHRVKAIKSLNESLSRPCSSAAEGDARFAAIMALAFQASCMADGMAEFMSMVRGCHVIANSAMPAFGRSLFSSFTTEGYSDSIRRLIQRVEIDRDSITGGLVNESLTSLRALAPFCSSTLEISFLASTERITKLAQFEPIEGRYPSIHSAQPAKPLDGLNLTLSAAFAQFSEHYDLLNRTSHEDFAPFADPNNFPTQLLLIHFFVIEYAIGEVALGPLGWRFGFRKRTPMAWISRLEKHLPERYRPHLAWPLKYLDALRPRNPDSTRTAAES